MNRKVALFSYIILLVFLCISCNKPVTKESIVDQKAEIPIYNFDELQPHLYSNNDQIVIVNFWAMWCAPCIKELPYLQSYADNHPEVSLLLVSLDFKEDIDTKLKAFLEKKQITAPVVLLDDPDANSWIDKVYPGWSGSIPFTIISRNEQRFYYERAFESETNFANEIIKTVNN